MTPKELKAEVDAYFGLKGTMTVDGDYGDIEYLSPTGIQLIHVGIAVWAGEWEVRSVGQRYCGDDLQRATGFFDK